MCTSFLLLDTSLELNSLAGDMVTGFLINFLSSLVQVFISLCAPDGIGFKWCEMIYRDDLYNHLTV